MGLLATYNYLIYEAGDARVKDNFMLNTPWPTIAILALYFYFIRSWGPKFMKNRQPYNIKWIIVIYNIIQVLWNIYIFSHVFRLIYVAKDMANFRFTCMPIVREPDFGTPYADLVMDGFTLYHYNKIFDLLDSVFFVLRKKFNHLSYLHVYHHAFMCAGCWVQLKYVHGGNIISGGVMNSIVHIVMYNYYLLTLLGFNVWWKKYVTQMQLWQFLFAFLHAGSAFFTKDCDYNVYMNTIYVAQAAYFFYMFGSYYYKTFINPRKEKKGKENGKENGSLRLSEETCTPQNGVQHPSTVRART